MTINLFNSQIREALTQNNGHKALLLFRQLKQKGLEPNNLTFPFVSKACAKLSNLQYSQIIHAHVIKSPFYLNVFVQTAMIDMYMKCHQLDLAHDLFVKMPEKDVASWNVMLLGSAQLGFSDRAFCMFREMRFAEVLPDSITIIGVSQAISYVKGLELAKGVHSFGIRIGIHSDVSVANTWISLYAKCGDLAMAESVFNGIGVNLRSLVSWNSMIAGYSHLKKCFDALNSYKRMLQDGFSPDISTIVGLLSSCLQPDAAFQGRQVHSHGIRFGCNLDIHVANTLISMYSKSGDVYSARCLFDSMCDRSCVSWTAMISGYAEKGNINEALKLFNVMQAAGEKPDMVTVLSIISGCGLAGVLEAGRWIDSYADSKRLKQNVVVCNALIDMFAKCGSIEDAWCLFNNMPDRTVVTWTTMIAGCALNGLFKEAMDLFHKMVDVGLKPNHITFLSTLQACMHGGFLENGLNCFDMMTKIYKMNPGLDHLSCIVDLLGRKGKLKEAVEFVQNMPVKPDAAIWSSLLSACKIYQDVEIGEYAAYQLCEMEPYASYPYVAMANIYASAGRWDGVARIRTMMKSKRVVKSPGQSLLEVMGKTHAFTVEDRDHHDSELIYGVVDSINLLIKDEETSWQLDINLDRIEMSVE